jgi:glycosyltransferase involved in cell wall biosynthesis
MPQELAPPSLHVLHFIAGLQASGAEIALMRLVQQSSDRGLRHTVVSLTGRGDLASKIEAAGGGVIALNLRPGIGLVTGVLEAFRKLAPLKPDIVQGWMVHGNLLAWAVRFFLHPRAGLAWNLRMSLKNAIHESPRTLAITRAAGRFSRSVDLLISNSVSGLEDHEAVGYRPRRAAVIPNGYDPEVFRPDPVDRERLRDAWALPEDAVVYGLIGRYHASKGHDVFMRAAALMERHPDMVFVLVGRDAWADNAELTAALDHLGVRDRFRLLGPRDDVPAILCGLDVVCVPSVYEGFPNSLGEAMATGLPCIATDVSDIRTILDGGGLLIDVGDHEALAEAMLALRNMGPRGRTELGAKARGVILRNYTLGAVADAYLEQYRAMSRRSAQPQDLKKADGE